MGLPDSYTYKPGAIPDYFDAMKNAEPPERFSIRFLENLGFKSTNDRLFIGVLKDLRFIDDDGVPTQRYFEFLDKSQSAKVIAQGIREAYSDLFAINKEAYSLEAEDVKNKLRTLYKGAKTDQIIGRIATTFTALCEIADFSVPVSQNVESPSESGISPSPASGLGLDGNGGPLSAQKPTATGSKIVSPIALDSLQYHINIILPESRDQAVYDAIFKSLRDHLG